MTRRSAALINKHRARCTFPGVRRDNRSKEREGSMSDKGWRFFMDDEDLFNLEDILQVCTSDRSTGNALDFLVPHHDQSALQPSSDPLCLHVSRPCASCNQELLTVPQSRGIAQA